MPLMESYKTLRGELGKLGLPWDVPPHLIWRLAAAQGDEAVQHVEATLTQTTSRVYSGTVVMFTETRVTRAVMTDGPSEPSQQTLTSSVALETWSRAALRSLEFAPDLDGRRNLDVDWTNLNVGERGFPPDFAVTLHYEGHEPLRLPLPAEYRQSERTARLFDFLPTLLADVSYRSRREDERGHPRPADQGKRSSTNG